MRMSMHALAVETFAPTLRTLSQLLDKGAEHARTQGTDVATLVNARLAPDMFPLGTQVQIACFTAKDATARLTGQEPLKLDGRELTLAELKALIEQTIAVLTDTGAAAFAGAEDRKIKVVLQAPLVFEADGFTYLFHWALPHFYFHVVTAYDILRHCGVEIGKRDYMSHAGRYISQRA